MEAVRVEVMREAGKYHHLRWSWQMHTHKHTWQEANTRSCLQTGKYIYLAAAVCVCVCTCRKNETQVRRKLIFTDMFH